MRTTGTTRAVFDVRVVEAMTYFPVDDIDTARLAVTDRIAFWRGVDIERD